MSKVLIPLFPNPQSLHLFIQSLLQPSFFPWRDYERSHVILLTRWPCLTTSSCSLPSTLTSRFTSSGLFSTLSRLRWLFECPLILFLVGTIEIGWSTSRLFVLWPQLEGPISVSLPFLDHLVLGVLLWAEDGLLVLIDFNGLLQVMVVDVWLSLERDFALLVHVAFHVLLVVVQRSQEYFLL